jgi:hypothetical protein
LAAAACASESPAFDDPAASSAQSVTGPPAGAQPSFDLAPLRISAGKWTGFEDRNGRPFWPTGMITGGGAYGGAEGWPLIDDVTLRLIHDNGGNFTHINLGPFVRWFEGPEDEAYVFNENTGRYNLGAWNEPFWNRVDHLLTYAEELGIYVEVDLVDGWTMKDHDDVPPPNDRISPWQAGHNDNGVAYDCTNMPTNNPTAKAWLAKIAQVTGGHRNVIYQVGNETKTCPPMGKPAWEAMVVAEMTQHLPDTRLFSTNSENRNIENAAWIDYVNRHRDYPEPYELIVEKPVGVNEYTDSTVAQFIREIWHSFTLGTYLAYWQGTHDFYQRQDTLAALHFFHTVLGKTDLGRYTPHPLIPHRLVGRRHQDYIGHFYDYPAAPDTTTITITELADPEDRFDVRWYDPSAGVLRAAYVIPGGAPRTFTPPSAGSWVLHVHRQGPTPAPQPGTWLDEKFDDLSVGWLDGQRNWVRIDDSASVEGGADKVAVLRSGPTAVAVNRDVPIQTAGKHRFDLRVWVDGNASTMAKVELGTLRGNDAPLDDDKFQIEFGASKFRINRIGVPEADVIAAGQVQLRRWYAIRCDVDLDASTVSVYVDGALAVPNYSMKPGPITDVQLMGFQFGAGTVQFDDLHGGAVRYFDVPPWHPFYAAIEAATQSGITGGCGASAFCPDDNVTRAQMAVFLMRAAMGPLWVPPPAIGLFPDVPASDPFAPWIEAVVQRGAVGSCSNLGMLYCPAGAATRAEMAGFVLRAEHTGAYVPPPASWFFVDVPPGDDQPWIDQFYREKFTGGCSAMPLSYCPMPNVTRGQMAAFAVVLQARMGGVEL